MSDKPLTPRQKEILSYISEHIDLHGCPPTRAELSTRFGFRSPNAAESHLKALDSKGVIQLERGRSRGITLTTLAAASLPAGQRTALPVVGRVAAGSPVLAQENIEQEVRVDPALFRPRPHYLLRVEGQSMQDIGILDGDLLAVHRTPEARDGQIVVARIEDEVTVKRFEHAGDRVLLHAENPDYAPIEVDLRRESLAIEGLGVGVLRRFGDR